MFSKKLSFILFLLLFQKSFSQQDLPSTEEPSEAMRISRTLATEDDSFSTDPRSITPEKDPKYFQSDEKGALDKFANTLVERCLAKAISELEQEQESLLLNMLPPETLIHILSYLTTPQEIATIRLVCRTFYILSQEREALQKIHIKFNNLTQANYFFISSHPTWERISGLTLKDDRMMVPINLSSFRHLSKLKIRGCKDIRDFSFLLEMRSLKTLDIGNTHFHQMSDLRNLFALNTLYIDSCHNLNSLEGLERPLFVHKIAMNNLKNLESLKGIRFLPYLHELSARSNQILENIEGIEMLKNLEVVDFEGCGNLADIRALATLDRIFQLKLSLTGARNISFLPHPQKLQSLHISIAGLRDISVISNFKALIFLGLEKTDIEGLDPLRDHPALETLDIQDCSSLQDPETLISVLETIPTLKYLAVQNTCLTQENLASFAASREAIAIKYSEEPIHP